MKLLLRQWQKEDIVYKMNKVEKSLLDTDILSEIIKRANPRIIISLPKNSRFRIFANTK
jgi:hypothetical protein